MTSNAKKDLVFNYLTLLFEKVEINAGESKIYGNIGDYALFSVSRDGHINFSTFDFSTIHRMFSISEGDAVDYIREYLSKKLEIDLSTSAFYSIHREFI